MNNVLLIDGLLYEDFIKDFVKQFNSLDLSKPVIIYINSGGGYVTSASVIVDLINRYKDNITLIATGTIYSAAFDIFFLSKCRRIILSDNVTGMTHFSWSNIEISEAGKAKTDSDTFALQELKNSKLNTLKLLKEIGLNEKELRLVRNNKDCYFNAKRLNELLDGQKDKLS